MEVWNNHKKSSTLPPSPVLSRLDNEPTVQALLPPLVSSPQDVQLNTASPCRSSYKVTDHANKLAPPPPYLQPLIHCHEAGVPSPPPPLFPSSSEVQVKTASPCVQGCPCTLYMSKITDCAKELGPPPPTSPKLLIPCYGATVPSPPVPVYPSTPKGHLRATSPCVEGRPCISYISKMRKFAEKLGLYMVTATPLHPKPLIPCYEATVSSPPAPVYPSTPEGELKATSPCVEGSPCISYISKMRNSAEQLGVYIITDRTKNLGSPPPPSSKPWMGRPVVFPPIIQSGCIEGSPCSSCIHMVTDQSSKEMRTTSTISKAI